MIRETRISESRTTAGFMRGGKLAPVMGVAFKGGEGGMLTQDIVAELAPVVGRLVTPVTLQVHAVWVPVQAMMALHYEADPVAGVTEVIRQRLLNGETLFGLEVENELSKRMGINPVSIGGIKKVSTAARLAHNAAVNYLRKRLYAYAAEVSDLNKDVTPALLSRTVLDMFNGVLDPDNHVNGAVDFDLNVLSAPVVGIGYKADAAGATQPLQMTGGSVAGSSAGNYKPAYAATDAVRPFPSIYANLQGVSAGGFSLVDLYNAETIDRLTREMRDIIDANPVDGEEQVIRWAHGLSMETGQRCALLYSTERTLGQDVISATDAVGLEEETIQSRLAGRVQFAIPVPRTELGGVVVTFVSVKPDEVLYEQPHPRLAAPWGKDNLVADELQMDPVPVTARQLQADVPQFSEENVCFYTGFNELMRSYVSYGWSRATDPSLIDVKNTMWQYKVPASVSPGNVAYPADIPHYPFPDQAAEVVRYSCSSVLRGTSPIFVGPSPVETVSVIADENLLPKAMADDASL